MNSYYINYYLKIQKMKFYCYSFIDFFRDFVSNLIGKLVNINHFK